MNVGTMTERVTVPMDADLRERLERIADLVDRPLSWVIRKACEEYLHRKGMHSG